jgi:exonuclease VII small subunit
VSDGDEIDVKVERVAEIIAKLEAGDASLGEGQELLAEGRELIDELAAGEGGVTERE